MKPIRILFLAANPQDTTPLQLSEEVRTIDQRLRTADFRDRFELVQSWAVRETDLAEALLRYKPHIVHFSGHGSASGQVILENRSRLMQPVSAKAFADLFSILSDNIRCVVLNACYSQYQAEAIVQHIDIVVGMSCAISDPSAIAFAGGFYRGLGWGRSILTSFRLGCNEIDLGGLGETNTPKLLVRTGIDPAKVYLVEVDTLTSSQRLGNSSLRVVQQKTHPDQIRRFKYKSIVGRENELRRIEKIFNMDRGLALAIVAPSGYGKTVLARKYVAEKTRGVAEAYIDANTISTPQLLAEHLANIFPDQAWKALIELGGRQLSELDRPSIKRFIVRVISAAKCCLVVDHAEAWLNPETALSSTYREIHATIAASVSVASWPSCILTTTVVPTYQMPYRITLFQLGPLLGEAGIKVLARNVHAPADALLEIVERFRGHPYTLDLLSRHLAGSYESQEAISELLQSINSLPTEVLSVFRAEIDKLTPPQLTLLLAISAYEKPMPVLWVDKSAAEFLQSRGLLAHEVEIESGTAGWVVHPLVNETIRISFDLVNQMNIAIRNVLSETVQNGYVQASLPLARSALAMGSMDDALAITNTYWRVWAESTGIDEGLRFVRALARSPELPLRERADLLFKAGVLHLYKGDSHHLKTAQDYFREVQESVDNDISKFPLLAASIAEEMEVTRRLSGVKQASILYERVMSEYPRVDSWTDHDETERYYRGVVYFLLGHISRYANAFDLAMDHYRKATSVFENQNNFTAKYEILHAVYGTSTCLLRSGKPQEALDQLSGYESNTAVAKSHFLKGLYLYLKAVCYLSLQTWNKASESIRAATTSFKSFQSFGYWARALCLAGWLDLLSGHPTNAHSTFAQILELSGLRKDLRARAKCGVGVCLLIQNDADWFQSWGDGIKQLVEVEDLLAVYSVIRATQLIVCRNSNVALGPLDKWDFRMDCSRIDPVSKRLTSHRLEGQVEHIDDLLQLVASFYPYLAEVHHDLMGLG